MEEGCKRHLQAINIAVEVLEIPWGAATKALEITLPGGSRITALPANPDTTRGFSANVLLDEFAFHADSRKIWQALFPVISAGHKLRVISTPNGKGNKFYELMTDQALAAIWSRHIVAIHAAVAQAPFTPPSPRACPATSQNSRPASTTPTPGRRNMNCNGWTKPAPGSITT